MAWNPHKHADGSPQAAVHQAATMPAAADDVPTVAEHAEHAAVANAKGAEHTDVHAARAESTEHAADAADAESTDVYEARAGHAHAEAAELADKISLPETVREDVVDVAQPIVSQTTSDSMQQQQQQQQQSNTSHNA